MARAVEPRPLAWAEVDRPFGARMGTSLDVLDSDVRKAFRRTGTACRPLVPHSPYGPSDRASPASRDCIHPFEWRLRLCDPDVATANSAWGLTVGSRSMEKPTVTGARTGYLLDRILRMLFPEVSWVAVTIQLTLPSKGHPFILRV